MNLISIQSHVAYGHVGNSAAVFALQRLGVEVWPIHTVQFSNHTGYGTWQGRVFDAGLIRDLAAGLEARGVLGECDGVLSGYIGSPEIGAAIATAMARAPMAARILVMGSPFDEDQLGAGITRIGLPSSQARTSSAICE